MTEENRLVVLRKYMDMSELVFAKSVLQSEDIDFFVENEEMSTLHAGMSGLPYVIGVRASDWEAADDILNKMVASKE